MFEASLNEYHEVLMTWKWSHTPHTLQSFSCWGCLGLSSSIPPSSRQRLGQAGVVLSWDLSLGKEEGRVREHKGDLRRPGELHAQQLLSCLANSPISFFLKSLDAIYLSTQPGQQLLGQNLPNSPLSGHFCAFKFKYLN